MLQKNHHFLFPQTYFGSIENFEDELFVDEDVEEIEEESGAPLILLLEMEEIFPSQNTFPSFAFAGSLTDRMNPFETKIGLYIHWTDV